MSSDESAHNRHTQKRAETPWPWCGVYDDRLALGEYYKPELGAVDVARRDAQQRFFAAVILVAPKVLEDLEQNIYPEFCRLRKELANERGIDQEFLQFSGREIMREEHSLLSTSATENVNAKKSPAQQHRHLKPTETQEEIQTGRSRITGESLARRRELEGELRGLMRGWGQKFRIDYDWVYDEAIFTMIMFSDRMKRDPEDRWDDDFAPNWGRRHNIWGAPLDPKEIVLSFELSKGWEPTCERWAAFRARATEAFKARIAVYGRDLRAKVEALGFARAPRVKTPLHYIWLVERVVLRRSWAQMATKHEKVRETIRDGVSRAAKMTGISLKTPS